MCIFVCMCASVIMYVCEYVLFCEYVCASVITRVCDYVHFCECADVIEIERNVPLHGVASWLPAGQ